MKGLFPVLAGVAEFPGSGFCPTWASHYRPPPEFFGRPWDVRGCRKAARAPWTPRSKRRWRGMAPRLRPEGPRCRHGPILARPRPAPTQDCRATAWRRYRRRFNRQGPFRSPNGDAPAQRGRRKMLETGHDVATIPTPAPIGLPLIPSSRPACVRHRACREGPPAFAGDPGRTSGGIRSHRVGNATF